MGAAAFLLWQFLKGGVTFRRLFQVLGFPGSGAWVEPEAGNCLPFSVFVTIISYLQIL